MAKYEYQTFTIEGTSERDIDLDVSPKFDEWQEDGWEYVSGPVIERYAGGERDYTFLLRRKKATPSAYEDGRGVQVI